MRTTLLTSVFLAMGSIAAAQSVPAEFPPASYKGSQYVDSKGCVFIRAGIDGNVTWVPRVSRDRKAVCGYQPSLSAEAVSAPAAPAQTPVQITLEPTAATPAPKPAKRRVSVPSSKPIPTVASTVLAAPAAPAPTVLKGRDAVASVSPGTRVVPRHVFEGRQHTQATVVPKGYKLAWSDDRLNPNRAEGTLEGYAATNRLWTRTVPRKLHNGGAVQSGEVIVHNYTASKSVQQGQVVQLKPRVSTKSVALTRSSQTAAGHGFVQVATFGQPANAQATARQLQRLGLPVRIGKITRKGQALQIVMAGPFGSSAQTTQALAQVRSAGYADAFTRK